MFTFMQDWSLESIIWFLPLMFIIHDGEEIITMERWLRHNRNNPLLSKIYPVSIRWDKHITLQFTFAVLVIGFMLTSVTFLTARNFEPGSLVNVLFAGLVAVFALDGVKHVGASIVLRTYTPGVITAAFIEVPYGFFALYRFIHDGFVTTPVLMIGTLITLPIILFLVWFGLTIGKYIAPIRRGM
ncbi:HXXEE domain-containing protein [Paenibacillus solani]|uniref:HXXEE domain-containing protein n=1 Tax=Paenibacillus solani TaxID=1705565 RepID=UPI003D29241C